MAETITTIENYTPLTLTLKDFKNFDPILPIDSKDDTNADNIYLYGKELISGDNGIINQIIPKMIELSLRDALHPNIISIARSWERDTDIETVKGIMNYVAREFDFHADKPEVQSIIAPIHLITKRYVQSAVSINTLAASLLIALGFRVKIKIVACRDGYENKMDCPFTFVCLEVFLPSKQEYVTADPVSGSIGGKSRVKIIRQETFEVQ